MSESLATTPALKELADGVADLVDRITDEHALTAAVAEKLRDALAAGLSLPADCTVPDPDRYVMYPLYVADDGSFSIASAVWNVGQDTPVHGHETWGVVGIYAGVEHEVRYTKPEHTDTPLESEGDFDWGPGQVTVCCTTDDDVHMVSCGSDVPCVGIHVYGADIGTLRRRKYDQSTGAVDWFVSSWASPVGG